MASSLDTVQYIVDQVGLGRRLVSKKMFGEFALYLDEKIIALVCDDQLFLKPTDQARAFLGKVKLAPPYQGARDYYLLTEELDDSDRLKEVILITANALPEPKVAMAAKRVSHGKPGLTRSKVPARVVGKKKKS